MKKLIFKGFSFLSVLVFLFIFAYAFFSTRLDRNPAIMFSLFSSLALTVAVTLVQDIINQVRREKASIKETKKRRTDAVYLLSDRDFNALLMRFLGGSLSRRGNLYFCGNRCIIVFRKKNISVDDAAEAVRCTAGKTDNIELLSLFPPSEEAMRIFDLLNVKALKTDGLLELLQPDTLKESKKPSRFVAALKEFVLKKGSALLCFKYGLITFFVGIFTLYRVYYAVAALIMLVCGVMVIVCRKRYSKKIF